MRPAGTHSELRKVVGALVFLAVGYWCRLLRRRLTVQMVSGQGLHSTHTLADQHHHFFLCDGQVQVLPLIGNGEGIVRLSTFSSGS